MDELHKIRSLHLFAGIGGGILVDILLGHQCVCAVESNSYCQRVLWQRQYDGCLPWFPIFDDIKRFDGRPWRGLVDIVCAGFPCQPFSVAGQRKGADDSRNLWPDTIRVIREVGPRWVFLENAPGLLSTRQVFTLMVLEKIQQLGLFDSLIPKSIKRRFNRYVVAALGPAFFRRVLRDLAEAGYDAKWTVLGAVDCGANHRRKRLWILAHANRAREPQPQGIKQNQRKRVGDDDW